MRRRDFLALTAAGSTIGLPPGFEGLAVGSEQILGAHAPIESKYGVKRASPFDVGSKAQLFVDQVLVRESERVAFTLHPAEKHPKNPLLKADKPWEGWRVNLFGALRRNL